MTGDASRHGPARDDAPHYHVIAENNDGELICSDGFTWPGAQGLAADLIAPAAGGPAYEPVQTVWIIEGPPVRCPLARGDHPPANEQAASDFVEQVVQRSPYWSA